MMARVNDICNLGGKSIRALVRDSSSISDDDEALALPALVLYLHHRPGLG